jgi:hypothetical protein
VQALAGPFLEVQASLQIQALALASTKPKHTALPATPLMRRTRPHSTKHDTLPACLPACLPPLGRTLRVPYGLPAAGIVRQPPHTLDRPRLAVQHKQGGRLLACRHHGTGGTQTSAGLRARPRPGLTSYDAGQRELREQASSSSSMALKW